MNKYRNKRTDGYASKAEAKRAAELKILEKCGEITQLREQVPFSLLPPTEGYTRPLRYISDFVYYEGRTLVVEDCKGYQTDVYKIKKRLMRQLLGIEIREVR